jgi:hypothetical protein
MYYNVFDAQSIARQSSDIPLTIRGNYTFESRKVSTDEFMTTQITCPDGKVKTMYTVGGTYTTDNIGKACEALYKYINGQQPTVSPAGKADYITDKSGVVYEIKSNRGQMQAVKNCINHSEAVKAYIAQQSVNRYIFILYLNGYIYTLCMDSVGFEEFCNCFNASYEKKNNRARLCNFYSGKNLYKLYLYLTLALKRPELSHHLQNFNNNI